jgi:hypothetical protein
VGGWRFRVLHPHGSADVPDRAARQIPFAAIVAVVSFGIFEWTGAVYDLLAGVLVGKVWEARRRVVWRARRLPRARTPGSDPDFCSGARIEPECKNQDLTLGERSRTQTTTNYDLRCEEAP